MVFHDLVRDDPYDLWIGDEAWELDYFLHENPELKSAAYVWLTDFVGWLPMPDGGEREAFLTADYNAEMIEHIARYPRLRDLALFVGEPDDVVPDRFGPELPAIRDWTERNFAFPGYVTGFDPAELRDRERLRAELGYRPNEAVCLVTVGGSGVGADLLRRVVAAFPEAKQLVPELRMIVVAGPADRPALAAGRRRARGAAVRPRPLPAPRGLRPRGRAGRPDDRDGADREPAAVPLLPAPPPLRAELPRPPPARALPRRARDGLRDRRAGRDRARRSPRRSAARSTTCRSTRTARRAPRPRSPSCSSFARSARARRRAPTRGRRARRSASGAAARRAPRRRAATRPGRARRGRGR